MRFSKDFSILFPTSAFYPSKIGGPANTLYWHCKALKKIGFNPIVVSTKLGIKNQSDLDTKLNQECGTVFFMPDNIFSNFYLVKTSLKFIPKIDIVHFSSLFYWPNLILAFVAIFYKKKIVWSPRGEASYRALMYGSKFKKLYLSIIKFILKRRIVFHATSEKEKSDIVNTFGIDIRTIQIPNYMEFKIRLISESQNYFLFVGRLHPIKAIDNLIYSLAKCNDFLNSNFTLKIAGDIDGTIDSKKYKIYLQQIIVNLNISNKIEFIGSIDSNKEKVYCNAYFLVLPSHSENFGNVVIESLSQGTPVIASKGTPWEILEETKSGFWTANDTLSLAEIISKCINLSIEEYEIYRKNASQVAYNQFDVYSNIDKWVSVYKQ